MSDVWYLFILPQGADSPESALRDLIEAAQGTGWSFQEQKIQGPPLAVLRDQKHFSLGPLWGYTQVYPHDRNKKWIVVLGSDQYMFSDLVSRDLQRRRRAEEDVVNFHGFLERLCVRISPVWAHGAAEWRLRFDENDQPIPPTQEEVIKSLRRRRRPWLVYLGPDLLAQAGDIVARSRPIERREVADGALLILRKDPFGFVE